jgi:exodeoxyribonuclease-1
LFRYRARHYPDSLNEAENNEWSRLRSRRLEFAADGGLDLASYFALLDELPVKADQAAIIEALRAWGKQLQDSL